MIQKIIDSIVILGFFAFIYIALHLVPILNELVIEFKN